MPKWHATGFDMGYWGWLKLWNICTPHFDPKRLQMKLTF